MTPEFITGQALLTLAQYKTLRGIEDSDRDAQISASIVGAEDAIIRFTQRDFKKVPATETRKYPFEGPIVNIDDAAKVTAVSLDNTTLVADQDYIALPYEEPVVHYLDLGPYNGRPASPLMGFMRNEDVISRRPWRFVTVTAEFGWPAAGLPPALQTAAALLVDEWASPAVERRGVSAEAVADTSIVYESPESTNAPPVLPTAVEQLLNPFRKIVL